MEQFIIQGSHFSIPMVNFPKINTIIYTWYLFRIPLIKPCVIFDDV